MKNKYEKLYDFLVGNCGYQPRFGYWQVGMVAIGIRDVNLHDDTCSFIASDKFVDDSVEQKLVDQANEYDAIYRKELEDDRAALRNTSHDNYMRE